MSTETLATSKGLAARVEHLYLSTRAVVDTLPAERFDERLPSGMTLREVLAHLAAWAESVPPRVEHALATGEDLAGFEDIDGFNATVFGETRDASIDDLRARLGRSHEAVMELLRSFDGRDVPKLAIDLVEWNTTGHYPDHFGDLGAATRTAAELALQARAGWRPFRAIVRRIGLLGFRGTTPEGWSYKDLVAHVAAWHDLTATRLAEFNATGDSTRPAGTADELNARFVEEARGKHAEQVVADLDRTYARLLGEVERLAPEQLHAKNDWPIAVVAGNTFGHYAEHHLELLAGVPATAADLLQRYDDTWSVLRARVRDIGRAGLMAQTSAGWTYRDLLAHLSNWLRAAATEIERREFRTWTQEQIEAENARAVRSHALVGAEAMVDELDASHRTMREVIAKLSDDDARDRRIGNIVAFYTYLAWEEHFAEMGITV